METKQRVSTVIVQMTVILVMSGIMGLLNNLFAIRPLSLDYREVKKEATRTVREQAKKSHVPVIHLKEALGFYKRKEARFLDARSPESFKQGHIPGAFSLPTAEFELYLESATKGIGKNDLIIAYCTGTGCQSSVHLAERLREVGYKKVKAILGGWEEWTQAGLPVEKGEVNKPMTPPAAVTKSTPVTPVISNTGNVVTSSHQATPVVPSLKSKQGTEPSREVSNVRPTLTGKAKQPVSKAGASHPVGVPRVKEISLSEAYRLFETSGCIFVDARHTEEYVKAHIPGAVSLPLEGFEEHFAQVASLLSPDSILVTYCDDADCNSSVELAEKLLQAGYPSVRAFKGGWNEWKKAGYATSSGSG